MKISVKEKVKTLLFLFAIFFKIGLFSFGGGYAMLTLIEHEIVDKRKWLTHGELADMFAISESTPGPIAINISTYVGTRLVGVLGGIIATLGAVLPSFAIIIGISYVIDIIGGNKWVGFLFKGIRIGVLALIARAVITFFKDIKKNIFSFFLVAAAFALAFLTDLGVIYIILGSILLSSLAVAFSGYRKNKYFFANKTEPYYNERFGKSLAAGEYYNERVFKKDAVFSCIKEIENKDDRPQDSLSVENLALSSSAANAESNCANIKINAANAESNCVNDKNPASLAEKGNITSSKKNNNGCLKVKKDVKPKDEEDLL